MLSLSPRGYLRVHLYHLIKSGWQVFVEVTFDLVQSTPPRLLLSHHKFVVTSVYLTLWSLWASLWGIDFSLKN